LVEAWLESLADTGSVPVVLTVAVFTSGLGVTWLAATR
jgi:hypothetical protein